MTLTASELGLLAAIVYFSVTVVVYAHPSLPIRLAWWPFVATVVLTLVSKHPVLAFLIDRSEARSVGFVLAILIGVGLLASMLVRAHESDCSSHTPPDPETHE